MLNNILLLLRLQAESPKNGIPNRYHSGIFNSETSDAAS